MAAADRSRASSVRVVLRVRRLRGDDNAPKTLLLENGQRRQIKTFCVYHYSVTTVTIASFFRVFRSVLYLFYQTKRRSKKLNWLDKTRGAVLRIRSRRSAVDGPSDDVTVSAATPIRETPHASSVACGHRSRDRVCAGEMEIERNDTSLSATNFNNKRHHQRTRKALKFDTSCSKWRKENTSSSGVNVS